jgi:hypothetical protein
LGNPTVIYVALLDEGTAVWRPVSAEEVHPSQFLICDAITEDEIWEFQPGDIVRCEIREFSGSSRALAAVERVAT